MSCWAARMVRLTIISAAGAAGFALNSGEPNRISGIIGSIQDDLLACWHRHCWRLHLGSGSPFVVPLFHLPFHQSSICVHSLCPSFHSFPSFWIHSNLFPSFPSIPILPITVAPPAVLPPWWRDSVLPPGHPEKRLLGWSAITILRHQKWNEIYTKKSVRWSLERWKNFEISHADQNQLGQNDTSAIFHWWHQNRGIYR